MSYHTPLSLLALALILPVLNQLQDGKTSGRNAATAKR